MNKTQKLQKVADEKFGENYLRVVYQTFTGFYAYPGEKAPAEAPLGCAFIGEDYWSALSQLESGRLN